MQNLNPQQQKAVQIISGPLAIIAGPGTGKTKTLVARIQHLLQQGTAPQRILALTFTKKAANEMKSRLGQTNVWIGTFHALCHEILGAKQQFIAEPQRLQVLKGLARPVTLKHLSIRELGLFISRAKNIGDTADVVIAYDQKLTELGLIDFDDLLVKTKHLLQQDAVKRTTTHARFDYILIDEFQDTNNLQYELLQLIRGNDNICVIGDPKQSIYGFRGASGSVFDTFLADFSKATTVTLATNYRSARTIVAVANAVFNDAQQAYSQHDGMVKAVKVLNEYSEAAWIINEIQQAIGGHDLLRAVSTDRRDTHKSFADFAILYRSRSVALALQRTLQASGLPFQVVGEGSPYDDVYVQAILTLLGMITGRDSVAIKGYTSLQAKAIVEHADHTLEPAELAEELIVKAGYIKNSALQSLVTTLVKFKSLTAALAYFDNLATQQFYDPAADTITLLTIHAAKGLEFSRVFLIGAEQGLLPHAKADIVEEKRLFYVAVTRAKEQLDILYTTRRGGKNAKPSQFLEEITSNILPKVEDAHLATDLQRTKKRYAKRAQVSLF